MREARSENVSVNRLNFARLKNSRRTSLSSLWMKPIVVSAKPVPRFFTMNATIRWSVHMCALRAPIVSWIGLGTFTVTQLDSFIGIPRVINSEIIWWRQTTAVWIPWNITRRIFAALSCLSRCTAEILGRSRALYAVVREFEEHRIILYANSSRSDNTWEALRRRVMCNTLTRSRVTEVAR